MLPAPRPHRRIGGRGLPGRFDADQRFYTAVSNIMKTKHDTVKNSISNIR